MFEEARLIARSRSRLALALSVSAALLVAGCYSKISEEDGGTMPAAEANKPATTPLEREQAAALAEQRKRVAALATTHPGGSGGAKKAEGAAQTKVASTDLKTEPKKTAPSDHERATAVSAVAPGAGGFWVQIGSGRDEKDSEALWNQLKSAHPSILGDASRAIVRADLGPGKGVFYRVHVGPYDSAGSASALCGRLRAARADCFLIAPGGAIMKAPEPARAGVEPTKPVESEPAKEKPAPAVTTARPAPAETKPAATPEPPAKASAETEAKKAEPKSDVPFRTMGLPGLPD
jgi:cell division septation protein DedD